MTASLFIVGAGGFGREVLAYARDILRASSSSSSAPPFTIAGFLDDNPEALRGRATAGATVLRSIASHVILPDHRFIIAVGEPRTRRALALALQERGASDEAFATLVHPTAYVAGELAPGCVLAPFSFVGPGARLAAHCALNTYASAGHDATLSPYCVLSPYAVVNGNVALEEGVFLGTQAAVVPGKRVGAWSKLGAGAVAHADLDAGTLALGNPAKGRVMFAPP
jgi:sugar O-acyltransferase (sialic acid O-acetyltransferase NeuD family)